MTKEEIFNVIQNNILEIMEKVTADDITIEKSLKDLGANSIDRMEIITMSMEELDIKIPLIEFAKVKNIHELIDLLFVNKNKLEMTQTI